MRSLWRTYFSFLGAIALRFSRLEGDLSHPIAGKPRDKVLIELIEADVEIGFSLVDDAKAYSASGEPELASRVLQEIAGVLADIECRLRQLGDFESGPFHPLLAELRNEIAALELPKF